MHCPSSTWLADEITGINRWTDDSNKVDGKCILWYTCHDMQWHTVIHMF